MGQGLKTLALAGLLAVASLTACGGGGGGGGDNGGTTPTPLPTPTGTAEGLWGGTTSTGRAAVGLVLDDGTYWVLYGLVGNSAQIAGVVQGTGTSQNGAFSSSNGKDFNFEGAGTTDITLSASYVVKQSLNAAIRYSGTTVSLPATYNADYELPPSLSIIAGIYSGYAVTTGGPEAATATISASGAVAGSSASGCRFSGTTAPRPKGNVYNLSVTFSGGPCANGTATVTGIAYWDARGGTLYSAALNAARSNGFLFVANKTANDPSASIVSAFTANILAGEKAAFEEAERATDQQLAASGSALGGNHVIRYKENLVFHVQRAFDRQTAEIISLGAQQGLRRSTIIPLVTKLGDDWTAYMIAFTDEHLTRFQFSGSIINSTKSELSVGIAQRRDGAIATLDSKLAWAF